MRKKISFAILITILITVSMCFCGCSGLMFAIAVDGMSNVLEEYETTAEYTQAPTEETTSTDSSTEEQLPENPLSEVTVLIYMNGSDLETDEGQATEDITEMLQASYNEDVNILIQTMGTLYWDDKYDISSDETQRFRVSENELELVDSGFGQLDCTISPTLREFIDWGAENYPAERYMLILWNHGAGPVYGFGYDEYQGDDESLTLDEIVTALEFAEVKFDFIGMDCCIMSCIEVCYALYDYCDYTILSEEFESWLGWSYEGWINALVENPDIDTVELGQIIVNDMIEDNEAESEIEPSVLAVIDQSMIKVLFNAWTNFAYANEQTLLDYDFSVEIEGTSRVHPKLRLWDDEEYGIAEYNITDLMSVAQNVDSKESDALKKVINNTIVYCKTTDNAGYLSGLAVTLPYGDYDFYDELKRIYSKCGIDSEYLDWLAKFIAAEGADKYFD